MIFRRSSRRTAATESTPWLSARM